jgi:hypothetical protein
MKMSINLVCAVYTPQVHKLSFLTGGSRMRSEQRASGSGGGADGGRAAPPHLPPELHPAAGHAPRPCAGQERSVVEPEP